MKRIINGVSYNTETSTKVAISEYDGTSRGEPRGEETLYQTRGGAFFLHSSEVTMHKDRNGDWQERESNQFEVMTRDSAHKWVMDTGRQVELLSDVFGEPPEAAAEVSPGATLYIRLPASLKERLDTLAREDRTSLNAWTTRCVERCAEMDKVGEYLGEIIATGLTLKSEPETGAFTEQDAREMVDHMADLAESIAMALGWRGKELEDLSNNAGSQYGHRNWEPYSHQD